MSNLIQLQIDKALHERIHSLAAKESKTEEQIFYEAIEQYLLFHQEISCYELATKLGIIGVASELPADLSTNEAHMADFGKSK